MTTHIARTRPFSMKLILFSVLVVACAAMAGIQAQRSLAQTTHGFAATSIEGIVSSEAGSPIQGALITDGRAVAFSDAEGVFDLEGLSTEASAELRVSAPGYLERTIRGSEVASRMNVVLPERHVRALYMNPVVMTNLDQVDVLIDVINTTNANAVVIDIKEEWIWYDTDVAFFRDAGTVRPAYDLAEVLRRFQASNIYTIARLVVFKDSTVAEVRPDLAITNITTGRPWRDQNGVAWVNPMLRELWTPNIDLAVEAGKAGFDEIQYDYIRFPTDGDLSTAGYGQPLTQESREGAIEGFLAESRRRLLPLGVRQSADVFGFTMLVNDDLGIGQNFANLAAYVDYLSPMTYPSHYSEGQFGLPGHPNDFPYEVVDISLGAGVALLDGNGLAIRPWLQDFDLVGMSSYGPAEVRAQIQAANDNGTSGWMLWDPANRFRAEIFDPEATTGEPNQENVGS